MANRRSSVGGKRLIDRGKIERRQVHRGDRLVLASTLLPLPHEPRQSVAAQGKGIPADTAQQAPIWGGDDAPANFRHGADGQGPFAHRDFAHLDIHAALRGNAGEPVLGVLRERAAEDVPLIIHPVDDQAALGHGHGGNGVLGVRRNAALEIQPLVLAPAEQAPERFVRELRGNVAQLGYGGHGGKIIKSF